MTDVIWVALIGFLGTVVGSAIGAISSARLTSYRLEQLEKKVNLHNNVIERTYVLEKDKAVFQEHLEMIDEEIKKLDDRTKREGD